MVKKLELLDLNSMTKKAAWQYVDNNIKNSKVVFEELWTKVENTSLTQEEAIKCLNALHVVTHSRIKEHNKNLANDYPTTQIYKNRLTRAKSLWFVDHYTGGTNGWSTLAWVSARKQANGQTSKASYHILQDYCGDPFYIISLKHGAIHAGAAKNGDGIGLAYVNAGPLHLDKENRWCNWAGRIPRELVEKLPPVSLDKPYRGSKYMQPYTTKQIINSIKIKRLCLAALPELLDSVRSSVHSDWSSTKIDTGPMWPIEEITEAASSPIPVYELRFIQELTETSIEADEEIILPVTTGDPIEIHDEAEDSAIEDIDGELLEINTVQDLLNATPHVIGKALKVTGIFDKETKEAVTRFQTFRNSRNKTNLKVDGKPGPHTCAELTKCQNEIKKETGWTSMELPYQKK
jgi:hypothetical protein